MIPLIGTRSRRHPVFNPQDLSRALADRAVSGAQVTVGAKLTFRNYDFLHRR
jgi:hypothetical protein